LHRKAEKNEKTSTSSSSSSSSSSSLTLFSSSSFPHQTRNERRQYEHIEAARPDQVQL
jgi:hypothetical protein